MEVSELSVLDFRSLAGAEVELGPGLTSICGPNGAGKTNLIEALYFALTGRSFRTGDRRQLIRFGQPLARVQARVGDDGGEHDLIASVSRGEGRRHLLDGGNATPAEIARSRPPVAVFSPDRLALIKGPPAERRAHLDQFVAARWPTRADLRREFGQALAQRNAMLARVAAAAAPESNLDSWDATFATAASALIKSRSEAAAELAVHFAAAALDLGLGEQVELQYRPRAGAEELVAGLTEHRGADLARGRSTWGPHLDELALTRGGRALRSYGSQGEQRTALLALLLAEREVLLAMAGTIPLLLLDDVMSELDPSHRDLLAGRLGDAGQTLITCADAATLPGPATERLLRIAGGGVLREARAA